MPSSWTDLDFELQAAGENNNTWGDDHLNNAIQRINDAFGGYLAISVSGDYSLTTVRPTSSMIKADYSGRIALLKFNGSPASNWTLTVPSAAMSRSIWNNTPFVTTVTTGAGSTVTIDAGDKNVVWCDGSGVHQITFGSYGLKDFITAQTAAAGAVPGTVGALGKFLKVTVDGGAPTWQQLQTTDFADYASFFGRVVALAVAL